VQGVGCVGVWEELVDWSRLGIPDSS